MKALRLTLVGFLFLLPSKALPVEKTLFRPTVFPVVHESVTSDFGMRKHPISSTRHFHTGVDLAARKGSDIRAIADGVVEVRGEFSGYGRTAVLRHSSSIETYYAHCDALLVEIGQYIVAGQKIGTVGESGVATGPHLHFEVRVNGWAVNPEKLIPYLVGNAEG